MMRRLTELVLLYSSVVFAQKQQPPPTNIRVPENVGVTIKQPIDVSVTLTKPIDIKPDEWIWSEAGAAYVGLAAALILGGLNIWLLVKQFGLQKDLNQEQTTQSTRQDEFETWQKKQAELLLFNDLVKRVDDGEARWVAMRIANANQQLYIEACTSLFRAVEYCCYLLDSNALKDHDLRSYFVGRFDSWKVWYQEDYLRMNAYNPLPYVEKLIISSKS